MQGYATPDAAWGITGPEFLGLYVILAVLSIGAVLLIRYRAGHPTSRREPPKWKLDPIDAAYLTGGPDRAVAAALTALRASEAVDMDNRDRLVATGSVPATATRFERVVHHALSSTGSRFLIVKERSVAAELDAIERRLLDTGLLAPASAHRHAKLAPLWLVPVLALGVARAIEGSDRGRPIGYLVTLMVLTGIVGIVLAVRRAPRESAAGKRLLERMRSKHRHLRPDLSPAAAAYGATAACTAVALFGASALWRSDPAFASAAGLSVASVASTSSWGIGGGGYAGGGGYYGCGGGSSDSGGGGGGGGCGGCGGGGGG